MTSIPASVDYQLSEARALLGQFKRHLIAASNCPACKNSGAEQRPPDHKSTCKTREITYRIRRFELNFGRLP